MAIDLDEGAKRDDLARRHLLTRTKRLHAIAEISCAWCRMKDAIDASRIRASSRVGQAASH